MNKDIFSELLPKTDCIFFFLPDQDYLVLVEFCGMTSQLRTPNKPLLQSNVRILLSLPFMEMAGYVVKKKNTP